MGKSNQFWIQWHDQSFGYAQTDVKIRQQSIDD
jgi:hypothetical protein